MALCASRARILGCPNIARKKNENTTTKCFSNSPQKGLLTPPVRHYQAFRPRSGLTCAAILGSDPNLALRLTGATQRACVRTHMRVIFDRSILLFKIKLTTNISFLIFRFAGENKFSQRTRIFLHFKIDTRGYPCCSHFTTLSCSSQRTRIRCEKVAAYVTCLCAYAASSCAYAARIVKIRRTSASYILKITTQVIR